MNTHLFSETQYWQREVILPPVDVALIPKHIEALTLYIDNSPLGYDPSLAYLYRCESGVIVISVFPYSFIMMLIYSFFICRIKRKKYIYIPRPGVDHRSVRFLTAVMLLFITICRGVFAWCSDTPPLRLHKDEYLVHMNPQVATQTHSC